MRTFTKNLKTRQFLPLPQQNTAEGGIRRVGVEIEFTGLDEQAAARQVIRSLGGKISAESAYEVCLTDTSLGDVKVLLDTSWAKNHPSPLKAAFLNIARAVVPVEIVTDPLEPEQLPMLESLRDDLRKAGAEGSRQGFLFGFGLHLNPEVADFTKNSIVPIVQAFALLEDWLRGADPIDPSRRVLPFVEPYPPVFVDKLALDAADLPLEAFMDAYLQHVPSRNHGLDLLPLLRNIDETRVVDALGSDANLVKARPTWHYRLPDCRIDEEDWSLAYEWNRWRIVECVAADVVLLDQLAASWQRHRSTLTNTRRDWQGLVADILVT